MKKTILPLGELALDRSSVRLECAPQDGVVPDDFYSTTVVTKLADRGSAQTVGVVTDVGLFLSLLAERIGARG